MDLKLSPAERLLMDKYVISMVQNNSRNFRSRTYTSWDASKKSMRAQLVVVFN
jgi:hypothetical protein